MRTCFDNLTKDQLHELADRLLHDDHAAIAESVAFLEAETRGVWHGRARALLARRLKHCPLSLEQQTRLSEAITRRLVTGNFSEQFKDQLRLVLHLDRAQVFATARNCTHHPKAYVRRYAEWILAHERR
jgi:hypothetical protein